MTISSCAVRTTNTTVTQAAVEVRSNSALRPKLLEISFISTATTAQSIGFGRPAAIGVTPTTTVFQPDDSADPASIVTAATAWGTSPTAPTIFHRRWNSTNLIGMGIIWTFPRGLIIPVASSVVIWNITATAVADVHVAVDE